MADPTVGEILDGRYEVLSLLGRGGMGSVYKARQLNLDRIVAIKVPSDRVLANPDFAKRFIREAHLCAKVSHPHIVAIFDVREGEQPYIVMEFVDGMPLNQYLHEEATTLFVSDLLEIVGQVCEGLDAAHARHIVHRDIKPANIAVMSGTQQVKIMDFGVARASDAASMTTDGSMLGTPYYMAPEQVQGGEVGPATDLYALAGVVHYLLTGRHVFQGEVATLLYMHVSTPPIAPSRVNPMLPPEVDGVLLRALDKSPQARQSSCQEFWRALCKAMRPVAQLPYSQMFPKSSDRPVPTPSPTAAARTVSSPRSPSASPARPAATPPPASVPLSASAPLPAVPPSPSDSVPTEAMPGRAETLARVRGRSRARRAWLGGVGLGAAALLVLALVAGPRLLPGSRRGSSALPAPMPPQAVPAMAATPASPESPAVLPFSSPSALPVASGVASPAALPSASPAPVPGAPHWLGRAPEEGHYRAGDWLTARWMEDPPAPGAVWVVEVRGPSDAAPVPKRRTADTKLALRLDQPGRYEIAVRPETAVRPESEDRRGSAAGTEGATAAATLRAAFDVAPAEVQPK
jgi:serine/threonine-protein kinase